MLPVVVCLKIASPIFSGWFIRCFVSHYVNLDKMEQKRNTDIDFFEDMEYNINEQGILEGKCNDYR